MIKKKKKTYCGTKPKGSQVIPNLTPISISGYDIPFPCSVETLVLLRWDTLHGCIKQIINHPSRILTVTHNWKKSPPLPLHRCCQLTVSVTLAEHLKKNYYNSLLAGLPDNKLTNYQDVQNHTAGPVLFKPRSASKTHLLGTLDWHQWRLRSQTNLPISVFSVSGKAACHHVFLTVFIHAIAVECCALLTLCAD